MGLLYGQWPRASAPSLVHHSPNEPWRFRVSISAAWLDSGDPYRHRWGRLGQASGKKGI